MSVENLLLDVSYVLRTLRKSPAFTFAALLTLMLGIGANIVVLGVLNAVLLRPLDVSDPQSLYQIRHKQWMIGRLLTTSYPLLTIFAGATLPSAGWPRFTHILMRR